MSSNKQFPTRVMGLSVWDLIFVAIRFLKHSGHIPDVVALTSLLGAFIY